MSVTLVASFENALTFQGMLDAWIAAWLGQGPPPPDTAAMILAPADLLSGPVLSSLTLDDLTLDQATYTETAGLIQVAAAGSTGLIVASWSITLKITVNTLPVGVALFNASTGHLWYVSAFASWPMPLPTSFVWNGKVTLNSPCQGS